VAGITVTNGDGVSGNPTLALANDLASLEGLSSTGIAVRVNTDQWVQRTITGTANQITVENGDGVFSNPTISLANKPVNSYFSDFTQRSNSGTSETVLSTKTISANDLGTNGDALVAEFHGIILSGAANFYRIYFGGTEIFESTLNNVGVHVRVVIWRFDSDTVFYSVTANYDSSSTHTRQFINGLNFAAGIVFQSTGQSNLGSNFVTHDATLMYKLDKA
jgi:hypothetical protein